MLDISPINIPNTILTLPLTAFKPKTRPKDGQNHEYQGSEISYMAPLSKMVKISLYQLKILSIFAFIGHWPPRPLEASADTPFSASIFPLVPLPQHNTQLAQMTRYREMLFLTSIRVGLS